MLGEKSSLLERGREKCIQPQNGQLAKPCHNPLDPTKIANWSYTKTDGSELSEFIDVPEGDINITTGNFI